LKFFSFHLAKTANAADKKLSKSIRNILGYRPGNIFLYHQAFLHKSASLESSNGLKINNERLEFLGDAILDAVAADYLFKKFPTKDEGFLTEMRSKLVSRATLNKLSQKMGVDTLIQLDGNQQGAFRSSKGDAFEALIGAIYLDKGYKFTYKLIISRIINQYFNIEELVNQELNFKSKIIEWVQREKKQLQFQVVSEIGQGYNKQYVVEVVIDGQIMERGQDYSIKGAEQNAAERSWQKIIGGTIDLKPEIG
jgi:ribonuclease-3